MVVAAVMPAGDIRGPQRTGPLSRITIGRYQDLRWPASDSSTSSLADDPSITMKITTVRPDTQLFNDVMSLGRDNAKTLGFFPEGAFHDYATRGHILACVEGQRAAGYLAFRIRHLTVAIVHLCVSSEFRQQGIARMLVDALCRESAGFAGVLARCRVDYAADAMWPRLGFVVRNEVPGRATRVSTTLRVWWRDLGLPDLFSTAPSDRMIAALDTSVLIDMQADTNDPRMDESKALLADWLDDSIEYVVTDEIYTDIGRNPAQQERQAVLKFASAFRTLTDLARPVTEASYVQLCSAIGKGESPQDRSDRRHLALAAAGGAHFFVTRDKALLDAACDIDTAIGIAVMRPCDVIARTHAELTEQSFAPRRLSGSLLSVRPIRAADIEEMAQTFLAFEQGEKKGSFVGALRDSLARSDQCTGLLILAQDGSPHGLLVIGAGENETTIQILRTTRGAMAEVISRHLVWVAVRESRRLGHSITRLLDNRIPAAATSVLGVLGFRSCDSGMAKLNGIHVRTTRDLASALRSLRWIYDDHAWIDETANALEQDQSRLPHQLIYECERAMWPSKLLDTTLPSYVVPIRPEWAAQLFHSQLAEQSLFGSDPRLMLRLDNVYYRSPFPSRIEAPSRVLWYVTASKERPSTKCIAASSLVSEIVHGSAKEVYSRFKQYGVYGWEDVLKVARNDPHGPVEAFLFGQTEPFAKPVSLEKVRELTQRTGRTELVLRSPSAVDSDFFEAVYEEGMQCRE